MNLTVSKLNGVIFLKFVFKQLQNFTLTQNHVTFRFLGIISAA